MLQTSTSEGDDGLEAGVRIRNTGTEPILQEHIRRGCKAYRPHGEHTGLDGPECTVQSDMRMRRTDGDQIAAII